MESKTPQFDALLDEIFKKLVPHERTCKWAGEHPHCEGKFEITKEDIDFLKMLRAPAPNFCPTCRRMRRFAHMNLYIFFKRRCDIPNHGESIISILPENCPFPVYDYKYFISDEFDAFSFGSKYKDNESPLEQLFKMRQTFPMPSFLNRDPSSVNSEYSNGGRNLKNGYWCLGTFDSEDVWYSGLITKSKDVMDSDSVRNSEHIYRCLSCENIYKSYFLHFSKDCTDSMFLFDCRNCDNCFGCVNLRGKKYCVWNEQLTKEEYEKFMQSIYPLKRDAIKEYKQKMWDLVRNLPMNAPRNVAVENVEGVGLNNIRNAYDVTHSSNSEHIRHGEGFLSHQDSMDVLFSGGHSSLLYSLTNVGSQSSNVKFSVSSKYTTDSEFVFNCKNIDKCFMCFGLQNKSYCIMNVQYSAEEYYSLLDKIKTEMLKRGEYEDGLGMEFSAQAYNFSLGQMTFPLSDEDIIKLGGYVGKESETNVGNAKVLLASEVPQTIEEVSDDILNHAIRCEVTDKPFRIIPSELQFYRKTKLPLPSTHPVVRLREHILTIPFGKKYLTNCARCKKSIYSLFPTNDGFMLYCEDCYKKEVY